jgi:membrane protein DedA with SNARE-associated domain
MIQIHLVTFLEMLITSHPYIAAIIASINEEFLVFLSILSGRGLIDFWIVFSVGIIMLLFWDSLIFLLGKSRFGVYIENKFFPVKEMDKRMNFVDKKRHLFYLILTKFVYGTRMASSFYYSIKGMKYKKFLLYDFISLAIWGSILLSAGYLAGKGFGRLLSFTKGFSKLFLIIVITIAVVYLLDKLMKKIFISEAEDFVKDK